MTQPSSPRRATAEEIEAAWNALPIDACTVMNPNGRRFAEAALNAVFALPSTHHEAIRAEEREADAKVAETTYLEVGKGSLALRIAAAIRARASSPRSVPAEGDAQAYREAVDGLNRWKDTAAPAPVRATGEPQTDDELAEMVARFRTPPGMSWEPLRDDLLTILKSRPLPPETVAPEGFVLVPIFPTEKMSNAGTESIEREYTESDWETSKDMAERLNADQVWAAMIAAAPEPSPPEVSRFERIPSDVLAKALGTAEGGVHAIEARLGHLYRQLSVAPSPPASETAL